MKIVAKEVIDLSKNEFTFPRNLREEIEGQTKSCGISVLKKYSKGTWLDVKFLLEDQRYIKTRLRLTDVFFVGYCKGAGQTDQRKWYTFSEAPQVEKDASGSRTDLPSSSDKNKKLICNSIKNEDEKTTWLEQPLPYTGQYCGSKSMLAVGGIKLEKIVLSRKELITAVETLHECDPTSNIDNQIARCAKSCGIIPIILSEAMRFESLHLEIEANWIQGSTKLSTNMVHLIRNWSNGSEIVFANHTRKDHETIECASTLDSLWSFLNKGGCSTVGQLKTVFGLLQPPREEESSIRPVVHPSFKKKGKHAGK